MHQATFESEFNKACQLRDDERFAEALEILLRLEQTGMHRPAVVGMVGALLYYEQHDVVRAMPYLVESVELSPRSARASLALFHALFGSREFEKAFDEMQRFLAASGSNAYDELVGDLVAEMGEKLNSPGLSQQERSEFECIQKRLDEVRANQ